jgi:hypothetical protein
LFCLCAYRNQIKSIQITFGMVQKRNSYFFAVWNRIQYWNRYCACASLLWGLWGEQLFGICIGISMVYSSKNV